MAVRSFHEHDLGLTWVAGDALLRTSHALAADGRVWLVDPVDEPEALERARALGEAVAVLQLYGQHNRDSRAVAGRLGVPHHKLPDTLPETPFSVFSLDWGPLWKEVGLWWPDRKGLVVAESIGTGPLFALGPGPVGVHAVRRVAPPGLLRAFAPEHLLVGHGPPVHGGDAAGGLIEALERSRRDLVKLPRRAGAVMLGMLHRH